MLTLLAVLSISLTQIPGIILRYIPFSKLVTQKQKKKLLCCYTLAFLFENVLFYIIASKANIIVTPFIYKIGIMLYAYVYFIINCLIIKKLFYQHAFVLGIQGNYALLLHSLVAIVLSFYSNKIATDTQFIIQSFVYLFLFIITSYPLWLLIKDSFILNITANHNNYWTIIWLTPVLLYFSNAVVTMDESWINTWRQFIARLLTATVTIIIWKCVNFDFRELEEKLALKSTNKLLHLQMEAINHQAETLREKDEKIRILRHDMRHNVQILSSLIASGDLTSASLILAEVNDNLENTKAITFCKNPIINSSLLVYITRAQEENIEIISEIDIPEIIPWNSNDMAILFANVLENAINASKFEKKGEKEIRISTRFADRKLVITVENRFHGDVLFNDLGIPISLEADHGIGMNSISTIVSKYHGHMVCTHSAGWFNISFMFSEQLIR